jgi:predicted ArsR family transcriptional regulator
MERKKRSSREEKSQMFLVDAINKMFEISGHDITYEDVKDRKDNWFQQWEMTYEQGEQWKQWGVLELKKRLKLNQHLAEREMAMINLMWGLKYSNFPKE